MHVNELLRIAVESGASDLHLKVGTCPMMRVSGTLRPVSEEKRLDAEDMQAVAATVLPTGHRERFRDHREVDLAYSVAGLGRFRCNVFQQRGTIGMIFRVIPVRVPTCDELALPTVLKRIAAEERGLVLVTGTTGSGKSTTLAGLVNEINVARTCHIMTIEDPIEYLHRDNRSIVNQREIGVDVQSFSLALRSALRQDPDVILVGEMRDLETISTALTAAETGHLVFATLHTQDAPQSIDRVIDVFPAHQQQQVRVQLAAALQGICTQQLLPTQDGQGRTIACEVMVATPAIRNLIREGKVHQIYSMLQAGGKYGMVTMDMSLAYQVRNGRISLDGALERCSNEEDLRRLLHG
jgi:twitching motility protein PilT